MLRFPMAAAELVPQRGAMLLVDEIVSVDRASAVAVGVVRSDNPFLRGVGRLDPIASIELLAQGAAALEGARRLERGEGRPVGGVLVGLRDLVLGDGASVGESLDISVTLVGDSRIFKVVRGSVRTGDRLIGEGELKLYVDERFEPSDRAADVSLPRGEPGGDGSVFPLLGRLGALSIGLPLGAVYRIHPSLSVFPGHFPGRPILPAVVTVAAATEPALAPPSGGLRLRRVSSGRFGRAVEPGARLEVSCEPGPVSGDCFQSWTSRVVGPSGPVATVIFDLSGSGQAVEADACG